MNKVLLGTMFIALFVSCGKSPEEKVNVLITESIKKSLYHPDTYSPVETVVDSAFLPFDAPEFYDKTLQLCKLGMVIDKYDKEAKRKKDDIEFHRDMLNIMYSHSSKESLNQAQEDYDNAISQKTKAENNAKKLAEELKAMIDEEQKFIGFKARHRYRANNNAGQTVFGKTEFLFDKDMTEIIAAYDMDDEEYMAVQLLYKQMLGEDTIIEDINFE